MRSIPRHCDSIHKRNTTTGEKTTHLSHITTPKETSLFIYWTKIECIHKFTNTEHTRYTIITKLAKLTELTTLKTYNTEYKKNHLYKHAIMYVHHLLCTYTIACTNGLNTLTKYKLHNLDHEIIEYLLDDDPDDDSIWVILEKYFNAYIFPTFFWENMKEQYVPWCFPR